jgi:hypothetical protein
MLSKFNNSKVALANRAVDIVEANTQCLLVLLSLAGHGEVKAETESKIRPQQGCRSRRATPTQLARTVRKQQFSLVCSPPSQRNSFSVRRS